MARGEFQFQIGKDTKTYKFLSLEVSLLEQELGAEPLSFLQQAKGSTTFIASAIFAGLYRTESRKVTKDKTFDMVDEMEGRERRAFVRAVFKAIVSGTPGKVAEQAAKDIDKMFAEDAEASAEEVPFSPSSEPNGSSTTSSGQPQA